MKKILSFSFILILSQIFFSQVTRPENTRMFEPLMGINAPGFIKHTSEDSSETYYSAFDTGSRRYIKRFKTDGTIKWTSYFQNENALGDLSLSIHNISIDEDDNIVTVFRPLNSVSTCKFVDSDGIAENLQIDRPSILKIDKFGKLLFKKSIDFLQYNSYKISIYTDNENNIYVIGQNSTPEKSIYLLKLNGLTGAEIFSKNYEGIDLESALLLFDTANNSYLFMSGTPDSSGVYNFGSVSIPSHFGADNLMLKSDQNGNPLFGKNFYGASSSVFNYSLMTDGVFDGSNFVVIGFLSALNTGSFSGLDNVVIPRKYPNTNFQGLIAKIDLLGSVIWQKPIYSTFNLQTAMRTNIGVDGEKNIYGYFAFKDKISFDDIETQYDATKGNKVLSKFNSNGDNLYFNSLGLGNDTSSNYDNTSIDVIGTDVYNINGNTFQNKFLEYPLVNQYYAKSYIATFGNLSKKYLTPENNYLELNAANIPNNPAPTPNEYSFTLVNNVNWTATSDQSWLNLSAINLSSKSPQQTINGNGDAKITLTADQNTTGLSRSSNVVISGEDVPAKTIVVSQTTTLGTNNNSLSIITMYPNPTSDFLNIKSSQKISKIEIYDMSGKLVKTGIFKDEKINVQNLSKGNYLLKIQTGNGVVNSKFIKN